MNSQYKQHFSNPLNNGMRGTGTIQPRDSVQNTKLGMLVFNNESEFNSTLHFLFNKSDEYLDRWEQNKGFTSFRTVYKKVILAEQAFLLRNKGIKMDFEGVKRAAFLTSEYQQYKTIIEPSTSSNGHVYLDKNLMFGSMDSILNENGMVIISGDVYQFTSKTVANLTKGYLRTDLTPTPNELKADFDKKSSNNGCNCSGENSRTNGLIIDEGTNLLNYTEKKNKTRISKISDTVYHFPYIYGNYQPRKINPNQPAYGHMSDPWMLECVSSGKVSALYGFHTIRMKQSFNQMYDPATGFYGTIILFHITHSGHSTVASYGFVEGDIEIDWYTWALQTPVLAVYSNLGSFLANINIQFQPQDNGPKKYTWPKTQEVFLNAILGLGTLEDKFQRYPINSYSLPGGILYTDFCLTTTRPIIQGSNLFVRATKTYLGSTSKIGCDNYFHD